MTHNKLLSAMRFALYTGAASAAFVGTPALAQDEASADKLETVVVTGSRIRRADIETAQPVLSIERAQIENSGLTSVADLLQNLTSAGSPAISRSQVLSSGEAVGGYYIDLRNLGNNRTLVLIDGKRLGATTGGDQDLGQIPTSAIERIEVLTDGASSVYGSDAIAGVVNVITRRKFNGAEFNAQVGQFDDDDGQTQNYDFTVGASSDRGSVTLSVQYSKEDPVWARDRFFSEVPAPGYPNNGTSVVSQNGSISLPCGPNGAVTFCTLTPGANPRLISSYTPHVASQNANSNQQMMNQTGIERRSVFVASEYNITDQLKFRGDVLYNQRSTTQTVAGYPLQGAAFGIPLSGQSAFNPLSVDTVNYRRRLWEMPRTTISDLDTYRVTGGLEGWFEIGEKSWNWDVGATINRNSTYSRGHGDASLIALADALGPSFINGGGVAQCGSAASPIPLSDCVPFNPLLPFGDIRPGSLSDPALQRFLFPFYTDTGRTRSTSYVANIAGSPFALPAGDLGIAFGVEHRIESGQYVPDAFRQSGSSTGLPASTTQGEYSLDEAYLELDVPILADVPFFKQLSINVATRYSDYSNFGETINSKFGLQWRPIDDLLVRGSYAEGFRAPTIADLYGGVGGTFAYYTDPCGTGPNNVRGSAACVGAGVPANFVQLGQGNNPCTSYPCQTGYQFLSGSNPNLTPENSKSKTAGIVYSPNFVSGLDFTLDWWHYRIDNSIAGDTHQNRLDDCYRYNIASRCAGIIRNAAGDITMMSAGLANKGFTETEGYDFNVSYRLPELSVGQFKVRWDNTYTSVYDSRADNLSSTTVFGYVGTPGAFRVRSNLSLDWSLGDLGASWTTRYYSGMREACNLVNYANECNDPTRIGADGTASPARRVGANTFHDLQVRYTLPWKGTVAVGAENVGGHFGQVMRTSPNSQFQYYGGFDIGRFYYAKYTQRF